jgi:hypothetical protein
VAPVWACGAVGSAPPWHGGGQGFESPQVHQVGLTGEDLASGRHGRLFVLRHRQRRCLVERGRRARRRRGLSPADPLAPGHTLVVPREHAADIFEVSREALAATMSLVQDLARAMVSGLSAGGVNILNASGQDSEQSVFHLHPRCSSVEERRLNDLAARPGGVRGHPELSRAAARPPGRLGGTGVRARLTDCLSKLPTLEAMSEAPSVWQSVGRAIGRKGRRKVRSSELFP